MDKGQIPDYFLFIINPKAGRKDSTILTEQVRAAFPDKPGEPVCRVVQTDRPGHATALAAQCAREMGGRAVVFACGGDGTAHEVANGIAGTEAAMSILPVGTANDFARAVMPGLGTDDILRNVRYPSIRPIDAIEANGRICLNIASLGFDTKVQRRASSLTARWRAMGSMSYFFAIILTLFGKREYHMHYRLETIDESGVTGVIEQDAAYILAAICNGRFYGGGFNPAPQASQDDGILNVCLVDSLPLHQILPLIPKYKKGTHLGHPAVHSWLVTAGQIRSTSDLLLGNFDGEIFETTTLDFRVLPQALRFAFYP